MSNRRLVALLTLVMTLAVSGCASTPPVKSQAYAKLKNQRTFEYEFPVVWKGIEAAVRNYRVLERDPEEVSPVEMKKLTHRTLETDWIYGQSRDKYIEYKVNDLPKKKFLQTRLKYKVIAKAVLGGVDVSVESDEEIERLNTDGTPAGYEGVSEVDTSRPNELIERIQQSIHSAAP